MAYQRIRWVSHDQIAEESFAQKTKVHRGLPDERFQADTEHRVMNAMRDALENPFDSLESTYEYICLLEEALAEAREVIENDARAARSDGAARRLQALQIVSHKLHSLDEHMHASRRLLNDLRTLRRLLLGERELSTVDQ